MANDYEFTVTMKSGKREIRTVKGAADFNSARREVTKDSKVKRIDSSRNLSASTTSPAV